MDTPGYRKRYNALRKISDLALNKTDVYTKYRGVHRDKEDIETHTRYVTAIRDKWCELRTDMSNTYGPAGLEIESLPEPNINENDRIAVMWKPWRVTKTYIEAVLNGLKINNI